MDKASRSFHVTTPPALATIKITRTDRRSREARRSRYNWLPYSLRSATRKLRKKQIPILTAVRFRQPPLRSLGEGQRPWRDHFLTNSSRCQLSEPSRRSDRRRWVQGRRQRSRPDLGLARGQGLAGPG